MRYFVLIPSMVLSLVAAATATTYVVNPEGTGDFPTIQAAIDVTVDGDIIELTDGTFTGDGNRDVDFLGKAITVRSQSGNPEFCVLDCEGTAADPHRGFYFGSGESSTSVLEGVMVRNGYVQWPEQGGGVYCAHSSSPTITRCSFAHNEAARGGGGLCCRHNSSPRIIDCSFSNNASQCGGGAAAFYFCCPIFVNCRFLENRAEAYGGGIMFWGGEAAPKLISCSFFDNWALAEGGGVCCLNASSNVSLSPSVTGCTFSGNSTDGHGGGILFWGRGSPRLTNCTFFENRAEYAGGGMRCYYNSSPTLENTVVAFSTKGVAIHGESGSVPTLSCCDLYGNVGGDWVGCIADQYGIEGNICEDPLFCGNLNPLLPYLLHGDSPCAPNYNPECGLIGAWPVGCGAPQMAEELATACLRLCLASNVPNPFCSSTRITYSISPSAAGLAAVLSIYDVSGRLVRTLLDAFQPPGLHSVSWDGTDDDGKQVDGGIYFYWLSVDGGTATRQMLLVR